MLIIRDDSLANNYIATLSATIDARQLLTESFEAVLQAVNPEEMITPFLPAPPRGRTLIWLTSVKRAMVSMPTHGSVAVVFPDR